MLPAVYQNGCAKALEAFGLKTAGIFDAVAPARPAIQAAGMKLPGTLGLMGLGAGAALLLHNKQYHNPASQLTYGNTPEQYAP